MSCRMPRLGPSRSVVAVVLTLACLFGPFGLAGATAESWQSRCDIEVLRQCGMPQSTANRLLRVVVDDRFSPAEARRVLDPLFSACQKGLPVAALADKLEEGLAKGVGPESLFHALDRRRQAYRFAYSLLVSEGGDGELPQAPLKDLVEALFAGVQRNELRALVREYPQAPLAMYGTAALATAYLRQIDFASQDLEAVISTGLRRQTLSPDWAFVSRAVVFLRQQDIGDPRIRRAAVQALENGEGVFRVLKRLGFTGRNLQGEATAESKPLENPSGE